MTSDKFYLLQTSILPHWRCLSQSSCGLNTLLHLFVTRQMAPKESLERHKQLICHHLLNRDSDLLHNLVSSGLLRLKEVENMKNMKDLQTMGDTLVKIISERGQTGFQHFCSELEKENPSLAADLVADRSSTTGSTIS